MKKLYFLLLTIFISGAAFGQGPIITIISDGDCSGGNPKMVEIYADGTVDFSLYSIERQSNGGSWGTTTNLSAFGMVTDDFIYIYSDSSDPEVFATEYPSASPSIENGVVNINGDDGIRLVLDSDGSVVDQYGVDGVDGSGQVWEYADGFAKRVDGSGPDGGFNTSNWTYSNGDLNGEGNCQSGTIFETVMGGVGTYSTTASTTPTVNVTGNPGNMFYFENNGPSGEEEFTVSGINLTNDITVNASTPEFEFSLTSGGTFSSSVSLSPSAGTVNATTVYVRLVAGLGANSYTADATVASTGASSEIVSLSGTVAPDDPFIDFDGGVGSLTYNEGSGPSAEDSFEVGGMFLTENITVTAPTNFELSLTSGSGFGTSVTVTQTGGTAANTEVFIRLASGLPQGMYSGDVTATSAGAPDEILSVDGEVFPGATCANVGDIIITEVMQNPSVNGDPAGEYFEVYNTTGSAIDMIGWVIKDDASSGETHTISSTLVVAAGDYVVIGNSAVPNGNTPMDYTYGNDISLGNSTDGIIIECSSTTIDVVIWDNGATFPDPSGASMELSTTALDAVSNDDGANWGEATTAFGDGDLGTPGAANDFTLSNSQFDVNTFKIYPNPNNTGVLTILGNSNTTLNINVYDVLGQRVLSQEIMSNNTLNVSKLKSGVYLVNIAQDNRTVTKKLVIK
ncbi:MAG: lamin tail domain-containing protein [bacterium]